MSDDPIPSGDINAVSHQMVSLADLTGVRNDRFYRFQ